ncbi:MAG: efflux RND transporter periplasmic adaptor subunit [Cyclobacteriaceae bacterium]|nr:efflux RND transporter periplasmic adaptor subunit [Cyclobacteriaceae bacterium]
MLQTVMNQHIKYKAFALILSGFLLFSCSSNEQSEVITNTKSNDEQLSDDITITQSQFRSSKMELGALKEINFSAYIHSNGTIDVPPESKATVSTFYAGYVKNISLLPGDKVTKGQAVLTLENPEYIQMQQDFLENKSELTYLKADYERQKTLNDEHIASNKSYMKSKADFEVTVAKYEALKKKLRMMNINPAKVSETNLTSVITLYAPISGYITKVEVKKGMLLTPAKEAIGIINIEHLHLELNVFEKDIQKVHKGQNIRFKLPDNKEKFYDAEVYLVGKKVDAESRIVGIHGHLHDEEAHSFLPGMYIEAQIEVASNRALVLPETAVINIGQSHFILVLKSQNDNGYQFEKQKVTIGKTVNGLIEVNSLDNLSLEDKILIKGAFNMITE